MTPSLYKDTTPFMRTPFKSDRKTSFDSTAVRAGLGAANVWPNAFAKPYPSPVLPVFNPARPPQAMIRRLHNTFLPDSSSNENLNNVFFFAESCFPFSCVSSYFISENSARTALSERKKRHPLRSAVRFKTSTRETACPE